MLTHCTHTLHTHCTHTHHTPHTTQYTIHNTQYTKHRVQSTDVLVQNVHSLAFGCELSRRVVKTSNSSCTAIAAQAPSFRGSLYGAEAKHTTANRNAAQPNEAEKKVQCGTCSNDSWIFAHKWTLGRTCRFCCHLFPKLAAPTQFVCKRTAVDAGTATVGGVEPWLRETSEEKLDAAERAGDEGAVKKIRASRPRSRL